MNNLSKIIDTISLDKTCKVLHTSLYNESILELIERFIPLYKSGTIEDKIDWILNYNIWAFESDVELFEECIKSIQEKWGYIPPSHNLKNINYLLYNIRLEFDYIIGDEYNKVDEDFISDLEKLFGRRNNIKIKYDVLSYTIVKSIDLLSEDGKIIFICPISLIDNKNTEGIRRFMLTSGLSNISKISKELIVLEFNNTTNNGIMMDNCELNIDLINLTPNFNWSIDPLVSSLFGGITLDEYLDFYEGTSVNKEYFIKNIIDGKITEYYNYEIYDDLILNDSKSKNKYDSRKFRKMYNNIKTRVFINKIEPYNIDIPNSEYIYYNKPNSNLIFSKLDSVIFCGDECEIIKRYHDVENIHFVKSGITWISKSSTIRPRYIHNCMSDIESPVCELKHNVDQDELYFIMGWLMSNKCNNIIKSINKKNSIYIKDIKNIPYPIWVSIDRKLEISNYIKSILSKKISGVLINDSDIIEKINLYF